HLQQPLRHLLGDRLPFDRDIGLLDRHHSPRARLRSWSRLTASISTTPRVTSCQKLETLSSVSPLFSVPRISTASNVPQTLPRPPLRLVPPRMMAAITVSSCEPAALGPAAPSIAPRMVPASAPARADT